MPPRRATGAAAVPAIPLPAIAAARAAARPAATEPDEDEDDEDEDGKHAAPGQRALIAAQARAHALLAVAAPCMSTYCHDVFCIESTDEPPDFVRIFV